MQTLDIHKFIESNGGRGASDIYGELQSDHHPNERAIVDLDFKPTTLTISGKPLYVYEALSVLQPIVNRYRREQANRERASKGNR